MMDLPQAAAVDRSDRPRRDVGEPAVPAAHPRIPGGLAVVDVGVKVVLLCFMALVAVSPEWGNLEGKAPMARAITYPMLALATPVVHRLFCRDRPFPWLADLSISLVGFSDILGNRLDLYDTLSWFDDWMHFMNTGLLAGALVAITTSARHSALDVVVRALGIGLTLAVAWEVWEYRAFVVRSPELPTAYADTVVDLALGWAGSLLAGVVVAADRLRPATRTGLPAGGRAPASGRRG